MSLFRWNLLSVMAHQHPHSPPGHVEPNSDRLEQEETQGTTTVLQTTVRHTMDVVCVIITREDVRVHVYSSVVALCVVHVWKEASTAL